MNDPSYVYEKPPSFRWVGAAEFYKDDTAPAKPNCSENRISYEDIIKIAKQSKNTVDFLNQLPSGVLQKFTFVYRSESIQNNTSLNTPRVIRFNTDASLVFSYETEPTSKNFNNIEMINFNEKSRRFEFTSITFPESNKYPSEPHLLKPQIVVNHPTCLGCHGGSDPRPNWHSYPRWPGTYGSDDDRIGFATQEPNSFSKERLKKKAGDQFTELEEETKNYLNFREIQKDNSLFSTLPWPYPNQMGYAHFPYVPLEKFENYNYRPNAHFTIAASRQNAKRLARKFEELPEWNRMNF